MVSLAAIVEEAATLTSIEAELAIIRLECRSFTTTDAGVAMHGDFPATAKQGIELKAALARFVDLVCAAAYLRSLH